MRQDASENWRILLDRSIPAEDKLDALRSFLSLYTVGTLEPRPSNNEQPLRIGVCGDVGAGKTSFVKSLLAACNDSQTEHIVAGDVTNSSIESRNSHTHTVNRYTIAPNNGAQSPFQIVDTIGFPTDNEVRVRENYKIAYLRDMLDGKWPDGKGGINIAKSYWGWMTSYNPAKPAAKFRYDAILYVVTAPSTAELRREMDFLRKARGEIDTRIIPVLNLRGNDDDLENFRATWEGRERWPAVQCALPRGEWENNRIWIANIISVTTRAILEAERGRYNS
jgi:hypothetical protein